MFFSKKSTNVSTSVKGILSTSAEKTIKVINTKKNKPVHLLFKGTKGGPPILNVGHMLDPKINLGDPTQRSCGGMGTKSLSLCYPFSGQY